MMIYNNNNNCNDRIDKIDLSQSTEQISLTDIEALGNCKNRVVFVKMAFLLGFLGMHEFYRKKWLCGIIFLLASSIGTVFFVIGISLMLFQVSVDEEFVWGGNFFIAGIILPFLAILISCAQGVYWLFQPDILFEKRGNVPQESQSGC